MAELVVGEHRIPTEPEWISGTVVCMVCGHIYNSTFVVGETKLECPACHQKEGEVTS